MTTTTTTTTITTCVPGCRHLPNSLASWIARAIPERSRLDFPPDRRAMDGTCPDSRGLLGRALDDSIINAMAPIILADNNSEDWYCAHLSPIEDRPVAFLWRKFGGYVYIRCGMFDQDTTPPAVNPSPFMQRAERIERAKQLRLEQQPAHTTLIKLAFFVDEDCGNDPNAWATFAYHEANELAKQLVIGDHIAPMAGDYFAGFEASRSMGTAFVLAALDNEMYVFWVSDDPLAHGPKRHGFFIVKTGDRMFESKKRTADPLHVSPKKWKQACIDQGTFHN